MQAPLNIDENKRFRVRTLQKAENDKQLQLVLKEKCKYDSIFFCNTFCWTYDPRKEYPHLPYILYPKQEELFRYLEDSLKKANTGEKINLLIDKPRDVGATYTVMTWILWKVLFDNFSARVGSRKEDYVDKRGETDTLFYKIDYNLSKLPKWLLPKESNRANMIYENMDIGSSVSGESANPNFGRGGRKSLIVFDELGFWDWAKSSWESAGESTNFRIAMSTPPEAGRDAYFHKLLVGEKGKIQRFEFDWKDVPERDERWYEMQKETKSQEEFAREVLKSYEGTTEGKVYAADMRLITKSDVDFDGRMPLYISWDFGLDAVAMIWWQKEHSTNKLKIIDSYWNSNKPIDFYVPFVTGIIKSGAGAEYNEYELEMIQRHLIWSKDITHYGDPSVEQHHLSRGESTKDVLFMEHQIYVQSKSWAGRKWTDIRDITRLTFRRLEINETRNEYLISCLRNAAYPKRMETSQAQNEPLKPIHNWTSHFRSAYEYFCDNEPEGIKIDEEVNYDSNVADDFNNLFR